MIKHDVWKSKKYTYYGMEGVQIYLHPVLACLLPAAGVQVLLTSTEKLCSSNNLNPKLSLLGQDQLRYQPKCDSSNLMSCTNSFLVIQKSKLHSRYSNLFRYFI